MWTEYLDRNPINLLLTSDDPALVVQSEYAFIGKPEHPVMELWDLPEAKKIIQKQHTDGTWKYKGKRPGDAYGENYELLETWRNLRVLVDKFKFDRKHPAILKASEFILSCQTEEGDIRGILSNQYTPYYMGVMLETLIKAGYANDKRIFSGFNWLESQMQNEGGWIIPMAMFKMQDYYALCQAAPIPPDKELPFSHMATGMVLRAYAAHPVLRDSGIAQNSAKVLKSRFFKKDTFTSRQAVSYWFKFQFPFWWTSLLTALDSCMHLGFTAEDEEIQQGVAWFLENQSHEGYWQTGYGSKNNLQPDLWVTFAICRILKYFLDNI